MDTQKRLEEKRQRLLHRLPPLPEVLRASLFERELRCGKPSCHCAKGKGHLAFYLGVSLPEGKTAQCTLPAQLVPLAKRWIDNYHRWTKLLEELSAINRELLRRRWVEPQRAPRKAGPQNAPSPNRKGGARTW